MERRGFLAALLGILASVYVPCSWPSGGKNVPPGPMTHRWVGRSGDWEDPNNWSTRIVPRDGDSIVIDEGGAVCANEPGVKLDTVWLHQGTYKGKGRLPGDRGYREV